VYRDVNQNDVHRVKTDSENSYDETISTTIDTGEYIGDTGSHRGGIIRGRL